MAHSRMYHFQYDKNDYDDFDEDCVFEESQHFADYVTEMEISKDEAEWLWQDLVNIFGNENVTRNGLSFTIKKEGALDYFRRMRADLLQLLEASKDKPIEDFLEFNFDNVNWWRLRERIDSNYDIHFSIDDNRFNSITNFADDILHYCRADKIDEVTLELKQIFDFHY